MAKLYFRYGTMDSAKTLNLLAVAHNYRKQKKRIMLLMPRIDDRFGAGKIVSRSGLEAPADLLLDDDTTLNPEDFADLHCVLVDEAQFLSAFVIDQLRAITADPGVPVICFGLRTDFKTELFPGSRRLLELADTIEEIKTTCSQCQGKAVFNMRLVDGVAAVDGPQLQLGDTTYMPVCWRHYALMTEEAKRSASSGAISEVAEDKASSLLESAALP